MTHYRKNIKKKQAAKFNVSTLRYRNMADQDLIWYDEDTSTIAKCRVFDVMKAKRRSYDGHKSDFFYLNTRDWVTVIPVHKLANNEEEFLMVRQFRHGDKHIHTEFPAGIVDEGETPEQTALRELQEETGYTGKLTLIGQLNPNPALFKNKNYTFLAEDIWPINTGQHLDEEERLKVVSINVREVGRYMGIAPEFSHAIMVQAYYFFLRYRQKVQF